MTEIRQRKSLRKMTDSLLIASFLILVFLPLCAMISPNNRVHKSPSDPGDTLPESRGKGYERYWWLKPVVLAFNNTHEFFYDFKRTHVLRDTFVRWHGLAKVRGLDSSSSRFVLLGKQGWLFYTGDQSIEDYRHLVPHTAQELERMRSVFEAMHDRLAKRGTKFLVVIAPNKHSIYPEFMSDTFRPVDGKSRLDQFMTEMQAHSKVTVLDLRPALLEAKRSELVYFRTDTHWNGLGSFAAYQATVARLHHWYPNIKAVPREELSISVRQEKGGDLTRLLGIKNDISEQQMIIKPREPRFFAKEREVLSESPDEFLSQTFTEHQSAQIPRVIVFCDSFSGTQFKPLLSQHFGRGIWYRFGKERTISFSLVDKFDPDLVIFEIIERQLSYVVLEPESQR